MTTGSIPIEQILQNASEAMRRGDKRNARYWAQLGVSLAPETEEPWLILAAVASPRAAIEYLKQALLVNPGSERAMRGLRWAQDQLARQTPQRDVALASATRPIPTQPVPARLPAAETVPNPASQPAVSAPPPTVLTPQPAVKPVSKPLSALKRLFIPVLLLAFLCIAAVWLVGLGSASAALALIRSGNDSGARAGEETAWPELQIVQPIHTPTPGPILVPTFTPSPARTATSAPVPTAIFTPTALPTDSPGSASPTDLHPTASAPVNGNYTVQRGDTLFSIAQRAGVTAGELAAANQMDLSATIYGGQVLVIPQGGRIPGPANQPSPASSGEKYILVDISEQHLYAYQGDQLVYSFVASTGMKNATRVGVFHVLDKIPNAYGATWNIWMPNWMGIYYSGTLENGIHALPILSSGARLWAGYLGTPISFGCVVLGVQESQDLYNWADVGTTVEIRQ